MVRVEKKAVMEKDTREGTPREAVKGPTLGRRWAKLGMLVQKGGGQ